MSSAPELLLAGGLVVAGMGLTAAAHTHARTQLVAMDARVTPTGALEAPVRELARAADIDRLSCWESRLDAQLTLDGPKTSVPDPVCAATQLADLLRSLIHP